MNSQNSILPIEPTAPQTPSMGQNQAQQASSLDKRQANQHDRPLQTKSGFDEFQEAYSRLEHLSYDLSLSPRLSVHAETVWNLLNLWTPYREEMRNAPAEIIQERLTGIRLVNYFLEQIIASNPLLLPDGYQITNESNYFKLISAPKMGILEMQDECMAPYLPKGTHVVWHMLNRKDWKQFHGVVFMSLYSDFDAFTVGRITGSTDESFVLKRENPAYPDLTIEWSNVVNMVEFGVLAGALIL